MRIAFLSSVEDAIQGCVSGGTVALDRRVSRQKFAGFNPVIPIEYASLEPRRLAIR